MGFLPLALPFAELEVGQHLYWQLGNLKIHGQVFLSSWVVIGALLAFVLVGSRKAVAMAIRNLRVEKRNTGLREKLAELGKTSRLD